ncbi:MAG: YlxR family protein, partial [Thermoleophilaceae bacterium]
RCRGPDGGGHHVAPKRRCVACGRTLSQQSLLRFARTADGRVEADPDRHGEGRGAYLCDTPRCLEGIADGRAFARAFRAPVTVESPTLDLVRKWQRSESTR